MINESDRVLVDTSVWIEFFRKRSSMGDQVEVLIKDNSVWVCGMVLFELLQGVKSQEEKSLISGLLLDMQYIEMNQLLWQKAAEISSSLKKRGRNLPLSDIFIAALAIEYDLSVLTLDKHFEQIPGLKIYKG